MLYSLKYCVGLDYSLCSNFHGFNFCGWVLPRKIKSPQKCCIYGGCADINAWRRFEIVMQSRDGLQGVEQEDDTLRDERKLEAWERPGTSGEYIAGRWMLARWVNCCCNSKRSIHLRMQPCDNWLCPSWRTRQCMDNHRASPPGLIRSRTKKQIFYRCLSQKQSRWIRET